MMIAIGRWLGGMLIGAACGGAVWFVNLRTPLPDLPIGACIGVGLALSVYLLWVGLPLLPDRNWQPQTPRARAFVTGLSRVQSSARSLQESAIPAAIGLTATGMILALFGVLASIFVEIYRGFWPVPSAVGIQVITFGGALVCSGAAWLRGGRLGRALGAALAVFTAAAWIFCRTR
jgi:hypothetical protein